MFKETNSLATGTLTQPIFFLLHTAFANVGWLCLNKQKRNTKKKRGKITLFVHYYSEIALIFKVIWFFLKKYNTSRKSVIYVKRNLHPFAKSVSGSQNAVLFSMVFSWARIKHKKNVFSLMSVNTFKTSLTPVSKSDPHLKKYVFLMTLVQGRLAPLQMSIFNREGNWDTLFRDGFAWKRKFYMME